MNSDFVVEQSALIAQRATKEAGAGGLKSAVTRAFELLLTRRPDADELSAAFEIAKARGLNIVCRGLINANEFAFLP